MKKLVKVLISLVILISLLGGCVFYVNDYYRTDGDALSEYTESSSVDIEYSGDVIVTRAEESRVGLIFYPGGKVEYTAYLPLMLSLSEGGVTCFLVKMPLNLAVLDPGAADGIAEEHPEITEWYIGGHSLGGSMAASYIAKTEGFSGLILLASYSTADVSHLPVLSILGSEDGVMNREKYEKYKANLPESFSETVIEGGNHAGFGIYGEQEGDGKATITGAEQISLTADTILSFINKK